jgi:hypothetical protein
MIAASPPKAVSLPLCGIATAVQDADAQIERGYDKEASNPLSLRGGGFFLEPAQLVFKLHHAGVEAF